MSFVRGEDVMDITPGTEPIARGRLTAPRAPPGVLPHTASRTTAQLLRRLSVLEQFAGFGAIGR